MLVRIKMILYAIGGICLLTVFLLQYIVFSPPKLSCDAVEHNFGVVPVDARMSYTFTIRNAGGRPLRIKKMESNCMCAKASLNKYIIQPGESAALTVELNLKKRLDTVPGRIFVESNDSSHPRMAFTVIAIPAQRLMILPPLIDMGTVRYNQLGDRTVELEVLCSDPKALTLHIEDIVSPSPIQARLINLDGPGRPRLQVWLEPGVPIGPLKGVIRVEEKAAHQCGRVELSVRGEVTGPIHVEPNMAYFGLVKPGALDSKRIAITAPNGCQPLQIRVANISESLMPFIRTSLIEEGETTYLNIQLKPDVLEPGMSFEVSGTIQLRCKTGDTREFHVIVPVHLFLGR